ncbi:MAG: N-acetylmuramoyl-L-alanine amidase [Terriglobales bacterium]|jgi:N-acetylmuramoyl-L-alanine amidase
MRTQASTTLTRGGGAFRLGAALLLVLLPLVSASARVHYNDSWARQQFAKAERMREALNGRPAAERTRREYQHVIDSYRRVYFGSPASSKADPSVVATAELMVEMGRRFDDNKVLRGAVEQYRFLRKEYPGSKYRFDALFTIGEIYKDDLNDPEEARTTFENFLHRYPRNRLADDARAAVKEIDAAAKAMEHPAQRSARQLRSSSSSASSSKTDVSASNVGGSANANANSNSDDSAESASDASARRSALPRVTGVRHWSTPDYTRVAIDVEQEVTFASQRISHPDRIFFDLHDTKLASTLVGKTFDVDDGFLKKIRVAEFQPGRTRIVLEVDDLASYDAFLLPDPYRLIIDVHGKDVHGKQNRSTVLARTDTATMASQESDDDSSEPAASPSVDTKPDRLKERQVAGKGAVGSRKPGPVETDLPAENISADSKSDPAKPANGIGVIKTTVAVKGSDRRIPKTIVEADDSVPTTVSKLEHDKIRPDTMGEATDVSGADETKAVKADSRSSSISAASSSLSSSSPSPSSSPRRKKARSSTATSTAASTGTATASAPDTADLRSGDLHSGDLRSGDLHSESRDVTREARPTASGDRSLTRALGLKIGKIVIDAGHGGHDTGTIGPNGLLEKDVVLDVAKRLGRLLESRLGAEVIYTRQDDTFIPLETRTAIANRERADLFISIHANSSHDSDARGVETYYLNFTSSPEALEVAARENAVSEKSIHELQDLVKKIAMKDKIDESREFAGDVQESLYGGLALNSAGIRNRGIKKAPFIVLIGANMPSILAEISFVSNPTDERKMETSEHRQRIAESLYRGVSKYVNGLSGVKVASKIDKDQGQ